MFSAIVQRGDFVKPKLSIQAKLCDVYEIGLGPTNNNFDFRVEVFQRHEQCQFFAKIWRSDVYRLQPTFPQENGKVVEHEADERILVQEEVILEDADLSGVDPASVISKVLEKLTERYMTAE